MSRENLVLSQSNFQEFLLYYQNEKMKILINNMLQIIEFSETYRGQDEKICATPQNVTYFKGEFPILKKFYMNIYQK